MRSVIQRVKHAHVTVDGQVVGSIGQGMLVLVAAAAGDGASQIRWMADKLVGLRIFADASGKMNLGLDEVGGEMLIVSQFTLYGDCRKGKRPSYSAASPPEQARQVYEDFVQAVRDRGIRVEQGVFGAMMDVELTNDGPVTLIVDTP